MNISQKDLLPLRVALAIVFIWFGALKFFPNLSPAEDLATRTISTLTAGMLPPRPSRLLLASWECCIGLGLLTRAGLKPALLLLFAQMAGTALPLLFFPHETFARVPLVLTMEGQYIVKNVVLIAAGLTIARASFGTHAAALSTEPPASERLGSYERS